MILPWLIISLFFIAYLVTFYKLNIIRLDNFFSYEWQDEAGINNSIWNSVHGNIFNTFYYSEHNDKAIEVLFWPLYYFFPSIKTILFILTLMLGLSVFPLYAICKKVLSSKLASVLITLSFLLWAPLHNLNLASFRWILVAPFFIFWVVYFCITKNFKLFLFSCCMALLVREDMTLFFAILSIYQIIKYKKNITANYIWILTPIMFSILSFALGYYLIPLLNQGDKILLNKFIYSNNNIFSWTLIKTRLINLGKLYKQLFLPFHWLAIFSKEIIFIIPTLIMTIFLAQYEFQSLCNIHYFVFAISGIYIALIFGIKNISQKHQTREIYLALIILISSIATIFMPNILGNWPPNTNNYKKLANTNYYGIKNIYDKRYFQKDPTANSAWELIALIPPTASVSCTGDLLPALSSRRIIYEYVDSRQHSIRNYTKDHYKKMRSTEYIMLNTKNKYFGGGEYEYDHDKFNIYNDIEYLIKHNYIIITKKNNFYLLKKI